MKRLLTTLSVLFAAVLMYAQLPGNPMTFIDTSAFTETETLPVEKVYVNLPFEIPADRMPANATDLGSNFYMFELPHTDRIVIRTDKDRTKAVVDAKSIAVGGPFRFPVDHRYEYSVKEDGRRIILYYKDDRTYCGYIYDKELKVCQYFQDRKGSNLRRFDRFNRRMYKPNFKR
jgi:hypothetical protein